jgi:hypothetical protein
MRAEKRTLLVKKGIPLVGGKDIGLRLDQEKAYDRVHLGYLKTILVRFGRGLYT